MGNDVYNRFNPVLKPRLSDGKSSRKKPKLPEIHKMYAASGRLHFCFRAQTTNYDGWFVFVAIPPKVRPAQGKAKGWFAMHSVHWVNSPVTVEQYITQNIYEGENKKHLMELFLEHLENEEAPNYHNR